MMRDKYEEKKSNDVCSISVSVSINLKDISVVYGYQR